MSPGGLGFGCGYDLLVFILPEVNLGHVADAVNPLEMLFEVIRSWPVLDFRPAMVPVATILGAAGRMNRLLMPGKVIAGAKSLFATAAGHITTEGLLMA